MSPEIQLVVTDLDGTLIGANGAVSLENVQALTAVRGMGIHVAICSGRNASNLSDIALEAGLPDCAILSLNGGYILDRPHGQVLEDHRMDADAAIACLDILLTQAGELLACQGSDFALFNAPQTDQFLRDSGREANVTSKDDQDFLYNMAREGLNKFVYTERENPERLRAAREQIERIPGVLVTSSWHANIEIMPRGIDKGFAVRRLAQRLSIPLERVMAFGDNDNDLPMIRAAGCGVAMGNAIESVRTAARIITDTNLNHGVAKALQRYVLAS